MIVETTRFGSIEVDDGSILRMKRGLLGFEEMKRFCLIQHKPDTPFKWLQSVDLADLAFVVVDPSQFFADYEIEINDVEASELEIDDPEHAVVLTTVTIRRDEQMVTTNLAGPIVINAKTLVGMQIILEDDRYGTQYVISDSSAGAKAEAGEVEAGSAMSKAA
jgi:flagellar assembly factor FliW